MPEIKPTANQKNIGWIFLLLVLVFAVRLVQKVHKGLVIDYDVVTLGVNYFQFGFVRRGLLGSFIHLMGIGLVSGAYVIYCISLLLALLLSYFILRRMQASTVDFLPFVIILAALLLAWTTYGHTDMLIAAILMAAALAVSNAALITAGVCLAVGLAVHEEAMIYGLPLVAALLFDQGRYAALRSRPAAIGAAIVVASLAIYAIAPLLSHNDPKSIANTILSELPDQYHGNIITDMALYNLVGGARALSANRCVVQYNVHYFIQPLVAILMIGLAIFALSDRRRLSWTPPAVAGIAPMLFLWITATDMGRWAILSIFNVWTVCAVRNFAPAKEEPRWPWARTGSAAAVLVLLYPGIAGPLHLVQIPVFVPSPLAEKALELVLGPPNVGDFDHCDPAWRSVLGR
jgi:hypothetical protein